MLALFGQDMLRIWLREDFVWTSGITVLMVTGIVFSAIQGPNYNLGLGASTIAPAAYSIVVMTLLISVGTFVGTVYWGWGLWEVAACFATWSEIRFFFRGFIRNFFITDIVLILPLFQQLWVDC